MCHAWDLSASLGRPLKFPPESIPAVTSVVGGAVPTTLCSSFDDHESIPEPGMWPWWGICAHAYAQ